MNAAHRCARLLTTMGLVFAFASGAAAQRPLEDPAADWPSRVTAEIRKAEYRISFQRDSVLPGHPGGLHAANRGQDLRVYFLADGVDVMRRSEAEPSWTLRLSRRESDPAGDLWPALRARPTADGRTATYWRGDTWERWENTERGIVIHLGGPDNVVFEIETDLQGLVAAEGGEVGFYRDGVRVLRLVPDGAHAARFALEDGRLRIVCAPRAGGRGSCNGRPVAIRLTGLLRSAVQQGLSRTPDWLVDGSRNVAHFGESVATAGDVNGDGFSDIVVGAPTYDNGQLSEGRAFVYLGSASGPSTSPAWTAESNQAGALFGSSVAAAGDVNGDGFDDLIVGADSFSAGQTAEGRAFVYLGSAAGLSTSAAWTAEGNQDLARFGMSLATAGDVNGDGFDDVVVGAPFFDAGQTDEGRVFVYLGSATGLSATAGWTAESNQSQAGFGASVFAAGDVDGDGFGDVLVGAPNFDNGETNEGRAFVYTGSTAGLTATPAWTAEIDQPNALLGSSVATAGDVNGDGFSDVIVGAPFFDNPESAEGAAFLYLGSASGPSVSPDWTSESDQAGARSGSSVAPAGDVNGDGFGDVLVGASFFDNGETDEGRAFVYLGSAAGLSTTPVWVAEGDQDDARFGDALSTGGDVNGDGFGDLLVGASMFDNRQTDEGRAFVYLGSGSGPSTSSAWDTEGDQSQAQYGVSVAPAGDVNGDGFSDVLVGASLFDNGQTDEGRAFVYLGSAAGPSITPAWTAEGDQDGAQFGRTVATAGDVNGDGFADILIAAPFFDNGENDEGRAFVFLGSSGGPAGAPGWTAEADQPGAGFGRSATFAGDVNGDGFGDVIIGAPQFDNGETDEGRAFVFLGSSTGLSAMAGWSAESDLQGALFGRSVAGSGDTNGDGFGDVIVGAPGSIGGPSTGRAFVFLGSSSGLSAVPAWMVEDEQSNAGFGESVATAGDVNGDGFSDVIIGASLHDSLTDFDDRGRAYLYYGSPAGPSNTLGWSADGDQDRALFGAAVATAGDVNGDGFSDVVVGSPDYTNGETREGRAFVYLGSAAGPSAAPDWIAEGDSSNARFGSSVAAAGDVNADGFGDVIVGARLFSNPETREGRAFVYLGNGVAGLDRSRGQLRVDGSPIGPLGRSDSADSFRLEATGRTPAGRGDVHLQWEVKPLGVPFDATGLGNGLVTDTGAPIVGAGSSVGLDEVVDGLSSVFYRWRLRVATGSPFFPWSPWLSAPDSNVTETKLRTAAALPPPSFRLVGPITNELVFPDTPPRLFSWNRGNAQRFTLEWSRNPRFEIVTETSEEVIAAPGGGDIQVYAPDTERWKRILGLGQGPDFRPTPVFWRIRPDNVSSQDLGQLEIRALRLSPALPPVLLSPPPGAEFPPVQPPTLIWNANHNERYRVRFATGPEIGWPRVESGIEFDIVGTEWTVPDAIWTQVVNLSQSSATGTVYYVLFARDALDRLTFSRVQSLRVLPGGPAPATGPGAPLPGGAVDRTRPKRDRR